MAENERNDMLNKFKSTGGKVVREKRRQTTTTTTKYTENESCWWEG